MSVFLYPPLSLSTLSGPVAFVNDSVNTSVEMDSVTPANIKALPTELIFKKDGVNTRVSYDTVTPTNSEAVPVNIVSANGIGIETTVNLSGAQINVQLSDRGASPDAVRIGDGTNTVNVTPGFELKTNDADANISLGLIDANLSELRNAVTTEGGAQPSNVMVVGGHDGAGNSKHFLTDATGKLSVNVNSSALPAGAATEATLSSLNGKIPSNLTVTATRLLVDGSGVTQPVSIAATVVVKDAAKTNSYDEKLAVTTVETFTAPPNAIGAKIMLIDSAGTTGNLRFKMGGVAADDSGMQLQPARSEDLIGSSNISVCAESGTCEVAVIWTIQS